MPQRGVGLAPGGGGAAAATAGGRPPLGINTVFVGRSPWLEALERKLYRSHGRLERYRLQAVARRILGRKERIRVCLVAPAPLARAQLRYSPARETAHLSGLMVCASPWSCPVCSARISERRRHEVASAIDWARDHGSQVALSTFTLSHNATNSLESSLAALNGAYRRMQQRRDFKALRASYGLSHSIKAVEVTWSPANGFHPHLHVLQMVRSGLDVEAYTRDLVAAWLPSLRAQGASATARRGVDVKATWGHVEKYVTKLGRTWGAPEELTKANMKRGRSGSFTPWDLLRSAADTNDQAHANLFREYALTMKGTRQLRWSPGLKALVGIQDASDEDLAANWLDDDQLVYTLASWTDEDWAAIRYCGPEAKVALEAAGDELDRPRIALILDDCRRRYFAEGWGL